MRGFKTVGRGGHRDDLGASLVEFALLLPVLMLILFGAITGGITLSRHNAVQNSAREASRFAATSPIDNPNISAWLNQVATEVEAAATGDLANGTAGKSICVAYVPKLPGVASKIEVNQAGGRTESGGACLTALEDPRTETRVQVVAKRQSTIDTIFASFKVNIEAKSVSRYERAP